MLWEFTKEDKVFCQDILQSHTYSLSVYASLSNMYICIAGGITSEICHPSQFCVVELYQGRQRVLSRHFAVTHVLAERVHLAGQHVDLYSRGHHVWNLQSISVLCCGNLPRKTKCCQDILQSHTYSLSVYTSLANMYICIAGGITSGICSPSQFCVVGTLPRKTKCFVKTFCSHTRTR